MTTTDRPAPDDRVWSAVLAHRDRAIRVALARCGSKDDVDDVVQEAMLRVAAMPGLDVDRIGPLITVVVSNLATDARRRGASRTVAEIRLRHASAPIPPHDDDICDAHEARWLRSRMQDLAAQDRRALELRATGLNVGEIAHALGVTYKAAENALGRARTGMRAVWRATAALVGVLFGRRAATVTPAAPAVAATALAGALLTLPLAPRSAPFALPSSHRASAYETVQAAAPPSPSDTLVQRRTPSQGAPRPAAERGAAPTRHSADQRRNLATLRETRTGPIRAEQSHLEERPRGQTAQQVVERCMRHLTISVTRVECDG